MARPGEPVRDRLVAFVEKREGLAEGSRDGLAMAQKVATPAQLFFLAGDGLRRGDLARLKAQQVDAFGAQTDVALQAFEPFRGLRVLGVERCHPARDFAPLLAAEAIEPLALELRVGEPELVALAVDPQQPRGELLQHPQRHGLVLDEDPIAPLAGDLAPDDELVAFRLDSRFEEARPQRGIALEDPRNRGSLGPFTNQVARRARAGEQGQRIDDQRLAGAGLPGEHVQAGTELDLASRQNRQISHAQSAQHFRFGELAAGERRNVVGILLQLALRAEEVVEAATHAARMLAADLGSRIVDAALPCFAGSETGRPSRRWRPSGGAGRAASRPGPAS